MRNVNLPMKLLEQWVSWGVLSFNQENVNDNGAKELQIMGERKYKEIFLLSL